MNHRRQGEIARRVLRGYRYMVACLVCWAATNVLADGVLARGDAALPSDVQVIWDMSRAYEEATATRERICINGLWRWQPAEPQSQNVPEDSWGYFKVPGCWPGITDYMQKDSQTVHVHPSWRDRRLGDIDAAWYERECTIPASWSGRSVALGPGVSQFLCGGLCGRPQGGRDSVSGRRGGFEPVLPSRRYISPQPSRRGHATERGDALLYGQRLRARSHGNRCSAGIVRRCLPCQHTGRAMPSRYPRNHFGSKRPSLTRYWARRTCDRCRVQHRRED